MPMSLVFRFALGLAHAFLSAALPVDARARAQMWFFQAMRFAWVFLVGERFWRRVAGWGC